MPRKWREISSDQPKLPVCVIFFNCSKNDPCTYTDLQYLHSLWHEALFQLRDLWRLYNSLSNQGEFTQSRKFWGGPDSSNERTDLQRIYFLFFSWPGWDACEWEHRFFFIFFALHQIQSLLRLPCSIMSSFITEYAGAYSKFAFACHLFLGGWLWVCRPCVLKGVAVGMGVQPGVASTSPNATPGIRMKGWVGCAERFVRHHNSLSRSLHLKRGRRQQKQN